jgi:hypothetical protein
MMTDDELVSASLAHQPGTLLGPLKVVAETCAHPMVVGS